MTRAGSARVSRCLGVAAMALLLGSKSLQNAVAEGDTRTISLHHIHTGEDLTITYKRDGRYDEEALKKINHLLRDWRRNEEIRMDPRLLDVVWEVYRDVDAKGPIHIVCGYRSPSTNAALRRRSRGVAEFSQHMLGKAMDFFIPGVSLEAQREAGLRMQRGGVGYYPSSGSPFVHLDVGSVRYWPRMTHDQLARVFPNGRTVHVPSDGRPLKGYALALADIERRGSSEPSQMSLDAARTAGVNMSEKPRRHALASLVGTKDEEEDNRTAGEPKPADTKGGDKKGVDGKPTKGAESAAAPAVRPPLGAKIEERSSTAFNLASADSRPVIPTARVEASSSANGSSANDVIASRGLWDAPAAVNSPRPKERIARASEESRPPLALRPSADTAGAVAAAAWPIKVAEAGSPVPHETALSYATQTNPAPPITRSLAPAATAPRNAALAQQPRVTMTAAEASAPVPLATLKPGTPLEDPWLRALVLAPSLQRYLTALLLGDAPDPRELVALMEKPAAVVPMTFGADPTLGLTTERFTGSAVVFVPTTTFQKRTAGLQ